MTSGASATVFLDTNRALPNQEWPRHIVPPWVFLNHDRRCYRDAAARSVTLRLALKPFGTTQVATCFCVVDGSVDALPNHISANSTTSSNNIRRGCHRSSWRHRATSRTLRPTRCCQPKTSQTIALHDTQPLVVVVLLGTSSMGRTSTVNQGCIEGSPSSLMMSLQTQRESLLR